MAVPNNYIDKIKKDGDSRMISPAADMVRVDNDNFEGSDLDEVLDEVAQAIEEAGEGGYAPPAGGIPKTDLSQDVQTSLDKADTALQSFTETDPTVPSWAKQQNKPTYTAQEVGALPANTSIPTKTSDLENDSGFVTSTTMTTALAGKQDTLTFDNAPTANSNNPVKSGGIKTAIDAATPTIDPTTKKWIVGGQLTDVIAKGQDGQDGNSGVASADGVESVNNLNGGTTDTAQQVHVLGANQGKRLRDQIELVYQRVQGLYDLLSGLAFTNGKPAASTILPSLDWGNPKHNMSLSLTLTNATVKHNGVAVTNGATIQVEEFSNFTLDIVPFANTEFLDVPSVTFGGNSVTPTLKQDGSYSVEVTMPQGDVTMAITAGATAIPTVTANTIDCTLDNVGNVGLGGSYSGQLTAASHSTMTDAHVKVTMNGTDVTSTAYNASTGAITISSVTGDIVVDAIAVAPKPTKFLVSGGSSYCDLGFYPKATMSYRCLYKFSTIKTYGGNIAALSKFALPKARSAGGNNWYWQFGTDSGTGVSATINTNTEYEFILFRGGTSSILCNGQVIGTDVVRVDLSDSPYAFTHAGAQTSADALLVGSVLYIEVFDLVNGVDTLIHRFVADTQNGVNGFLDTVTNNFIPSASSTAFTISNRS